MQAGYRGWYPNPPDIIVRAVELGVNYLDSSNDYGPSQGYYGQAFRTLNLVPGGANYNAALRDLLYINTKTNQRLALDRTKPTAATAIDDLKTSLTVMFGDGKGFIPDGAYLDCFQFHNLGGQTDVDRLYLNLDHRDDPTLDQLGAIAGLLDYRDGTNITGLNPGNKQYIGRLGITGHPALILMQAMQRDELNAIETLFLTLNANDRVGGMPSQFNAVPVARARQMGIVAIKIFANGGMYGQQGSAIKTVGVPGRAPPADLIRYPLSIPGIAAAATGISYIDRGHPANDQLAANLAAAITPPASSAEMLTIEREVAITIGTNTNYFQPASKGLQQPTGVKVTQDADQVVITWNTAIAGSEPITFYEVYSKGQLVTALPFVPQTTTAPLSVTLPASKIPGNPISVVASTTPDSDRSRRRP